MSRHGVYLVDYPRLLRSRGLGCANGAAAPRASLFTESSRREGLQAQVRGKRANKKLPGRSCTVLGNSFFFFNGKRALRALEPG